MSVLGHADRLRCRTHVRFTPKSGHQRRLAISGRGSALGARGVRATGSPVIITRLIDGQLHLNSVSSSDAVPSSCTSAGAGSRSASRSGKSAPAARRGCRTHAAVERQ
jgi:hypothetical protein